MVESTGLENRRCESIRGFESHSLRQLDIDSRKYPSGRRGSPAKGVDCLKNGARVQIPPSAPSTRKQPKSAVSGTFFVLVLQTAYSPRSVLSSSVPYKSAPSSLIVSTVVSAALGLAFVQRIDRGMGASHIRMDISLRGGKLCVAHDLPDHAGGKIAQRAGRSAASVLLQVLSGSGGKGPAGDGQQAPH